MKKLLIALGLGSALIITPALAQTDQNAAPAAGASAPAAGAEAPAKPKAHHHKAKHHSMKKSKAKAKEMAPADANAPKTQ